MTGELIVDLAAAATRHPRWHEYGRPTTPIKAGPWPPASGGLKALTGACCSAFVSHQERFDGEVRAAQAASQFTFAEPNLTQTIGHSHRPRPSSPSRLIPNISVPASASSPFFTPGDRRSRIIHMLI